MTSDLGAAVRGTPTARRDQRRIWLQRAVARGFAPPAPEEVPVTVVLRTGTDVQVRDGGHGIGVLLPTFVGRCGAAEHESYLVHVLERLNEVRQAQPELRLDLWVGVQYAPGETEEARARVTRMGELATGVPGLGFVGVILPGPGKARTTNAVMRLSAEDGYDGWLWIDDDIHFEPQCLARVVTRFLQKGRRGAVGAARTSLPKTYRASRAMGRVSRHTRPRRDYPTACCMVVARDVVAGGIPVRRVTDDGFVLFELLDPSAQDPFHDLEVLEQARCEYYNGSRATDTLKRLRRSMYSHVVCMADYPLATARRYFTDTLFYGLWPLAPWDGSRGVRRGALRWLVKAVHFTWCVALATELVVRGLAGRPVRGVGWGADPDYRTALTDSAAGG